MATAARGNAPIPHSVLGVLLFVATELMFFAGLISAFLIAQANNPGAWPPPGQPRLPAEATAAGTLILLASGGVLWRAGRVFGADRHRGGRLLLAAMLLGSAFVGLQGVEWARLLRQGLTVQASAHGAFFYLLIGVHALHATGALAAMAWAYGRLRQGLLTSSALWAVRVFWYFVVGVWPVLYYLVYL